MAADKVFDGGTAGVSRTWSAAVNWADDLALGNGDDLFIGGIALTSPAVTLGGTSSYLALTSSTSSALNPTIRSVTFDNSLGQFPSSLLNVKNSSALTGSLSETINFNTANVDAIVVKGGTSPTVQLDSRTTSTLSLALNYTGQANVNILDSGTLIFDGKTLTATDPITNITTTTSTGVIGGTGGLRKIGNGTLILGGAVNPFTGGLTISEGTVSTSAAGYLGSSATLNPEAVVVNGGRLLFTGTGTASSSVSNRGFKVGSSTGTIEIATATRIWEISGVIGDVSGQSGKLVKTGAGELILGNPANTFTGGLVISSGILTTTYTAGLGPALPANDSAVVINGGTLRYTNGTTSNSDATRGFKVGAAGGTIDLVNASKILTLNGAVQDVTGETGSLTKSGAGKLILGAANTYSGATVVSGGTLVVNGSIAGNVSVAVEGSIGGEGSIKGQATVNGSILPGGATPGKLTVQGAVMLAQGGTATFELQDSQTYDRLDCQSSVSLDGVLTVTLGVDFSPAGGDSFDLLDSATAPALGSNFSLSLPPLGAGKTWDQSAFATTGVIRVNQTASDYDLWALSYSLQGVNAQSTADPDNDGFSNKDEYAFGSSPLVTTPSLISIRNSDGNIVVSYIERSTGVSYAIKSSSDLQLWVNATGITPLSGVSQTAVSAGYIRKQFSSIASGKAFFRIEATVP
jgi:autotransporter-associated beta strand protein